MGWYLYPHGVPASLFPVYSHWETRRPDCSRVPGQFASLVCLGLCRLGWGKRYRGAKSGAWWGERRVSEARDLAGLCMSLSWATFFSHVCGVAVCGRIGSSNMERIVHRPTLSSVDLCSASLILRENRCIIDTLQLA